MRLVVGKDILGVQAQTQEQNKLTNDEGKVLKMLMMIWERPQAFLNTYNGDKRRRKNMQPKSVVKVL